MKRIALGLMTTLMVIGVSFAAQKAHTYTGDIMDSQCAKMGSHAKMISNGAAKDAAECTKGCVGHGGKYVLYNAATKTVYQLDDQTKPEQFAGEKVSVTGTLDAATKTIHVGTMKAAS